MGVMDQGFKAWLDSSKEKVLPWMTGQPVEYLGTFPKELAPAPQLLPDSFYRVLVKKQECLVNVEVQAAVDPDMGRRLYEYGSRARLESGLPVFSVVLWLFKDKQGHRPPVSPYREYIEGELITTWKFVNIELYRLTPDAIMKAGIIELLPLLPFTNGATRGLVEQAMQRVKEEAPTGQVKPLAGLLGLFASRFYGKAFALDLFGRLFMYNTEIMQEFPLFRDMMAEAEARGEARGEAKGKAEGKAEGKVEGERDLLRRILERRFGPLSEDMQQAITATDPSVLPDLALAAGTESLEQVRARLGLSDSIS